MCGFLHRSGRSPPKTCKPPTQAEASALTGAQYFKIGEDPDREPEEPKTRSVEADLERVFERACAELDEVFEELKANEPEATTDICGFVWDPRTKRAI